MDLPHLGDGLARNSGPGGAAGERPGDLHGLADRTDVQAAEDVIDERGRIGKAGALSGEDRTRVVSGLSLRPPRSPTEPRPGRPRRSVAGRRSPCYGRALRDAREAPGCAGTRDLRTPGSADGSRTRRRRARPSSRRPGGPCTVGRVRGPAGDGRRVAGTGSRVVDAPGSCWEGGGPTPVGPLPPLRPPRPGRPRWSGRDARAEPPRANLPGGGAQRGGPTRGGAPPPPRRSIPPRPREGATRSGRSCGVGRPRVHRSPGGAAPGRTPTRPTSPGPRKQVARARGPRARPALGSRSIRGEGDGRRHASPLRRER